MVLAADVLINCAGPVINTFEPLIEACMKNGCHYLDITGEIAVFEKIATYDYLLERAGIVAIPGMGFDVVPTDCLAVYLKNKLPSATHLNLGVMGFGGGFSQGTVNTALMSLGYGSVVRRNNQLLTVPHTDYLREINFEGKRPRLAVSVPLADVSSAWYSTDIPNITTFLGINNTLLRMFKLADGAKWLVRRKFIKNIITSMTQKIYGIGPNEKNRQRGNSLAWGEVTDENGNLVSVRLILPETYTLTALTAIAGAKKLLNKTDNSGQNLKGFFTPAQAFGPNFILEIPNTIREDLTQSIQIKVG
jgi:short subunit dehydrogenase-like uncharacterized protein